MATTTPSEQTGIKPIETQWATTNGSFRIKGTSEGIREVVISFHDWCVEMEKTHDVTVLSNHADYNGYWPTDRTRTKD